MSTNHILNQLEDFPIKIKYLTAAHILIWFRIGPLLTFIQNILHDVLRKEENPDPINSMPLI